MCGGGTEERCFTHCDEAWLVLFGTRLELFGEFRPVFVAGRNGHGFEGQPGWPRDDDAGERATLRPP
jgi:hypothetical protein